MARKYINWKSEEVVEILNNNTLSLDSKSKMLGVSKWWVCRQMKRIGIKHNPYWRTGLEDLPQSHQEWNKEDEIRLEDLIDYLENERDNSEHEEDKTFFSDDISWLKSLSLQHKPKWSEEDEKMLNVIISDFVGFRTYGTSSLEDHFTECLDWLKSLSPQNRWKPSKEQMEALKNCCNGWEDNSNGILDSLYNDLKAL